MAQPTRLPPRPYRTFSMRTVEKLHQRYLESDCVSIPPEKISSILEVLRQNLLRIEDVLSYRLRCPSPAPDSTSEHHCCLSAFERVRVGHILADIVLDLTTISTSSNNETYDALVNNGGAFANVVSPLRSLAPLPADDTAFTGRYFSDGRSQGVGEEVREPSPPPGDVGVDLLFSQPRSMEEQGQRDCRLATESRGEVRDGALAAFIPLRRVHQQKCQFKGCGSSDWCSTAFSHCGQRSCANRPQIHERPLKDAYVVHGTQSAGYQGRNSHVPPYRAENQVVHNGPRKPRAYESPLYVPGPQGILPYGESPISPTSMRFKPVQSLHSGADSMTGQLPNSVNPRKYYEIDFQRLNDFQRCLRVIQRLSLTDDAFQKFGLRYAIPGIRELNPDEVQSANIRMAGHSRCLVGSSNPSESNGSASKSYTPQEQHLANKGQPPNTSPRASKNGKSVILHTVADVQVSERESPFEIHPTPQPRSSRASHHSDVTAVYNQNQEADTPSTTTDTQCLPLFQGGRDIIVQKKDMNIFVAMVDATLRRVDQDIIGRLHIASTDFGSSSGEDEAAYY